MSGNALKDKKRIVSIGIALLFGIALFALVTALSLFAKNSIPSNDAETQGTSSAPSNTTSADADDSLLYENEFFSLRLPDSWRGEWTLKKDFEYRDAISQTAAYLYEFRKDSASFLVRCSVVGIDAEAAIGEASGYVVQLYTDELSAEDSAYVRGNISLKADGETSSESTPTQEPASSSTSQESNIPQGNGLHVENSYVAFDLPAAWADKVNVYYIGDEIYVRSKNDPRGDNFLLYVRIADSSSPVEGGDIGTGLAYWFDNSKGQRVEIVVKNYAYEAYLNNLYLSSGRGLPSGGTIADEYLDECIQLQTGGMVNLSMAQAASEGNDILLDHYDYFNESIRPTIVVK